MLIGCYSGFAKWLMPETRTRYTLPCLGGQIIDKLDAVETFHPPGLLIQLFALSEDGGKRKPFSGQAGVSWGV